MRHLVENYFQDNPETTVLRLDNQNINDQSFKEIAQALNNRNKLTEIDLSNNKISSKGAKVLAELLKNKPSITKINLSYNKVGDEGLKALSLTLASSHSIVEINLAGNRFGDEGIQFFAEALLINKSLRTVNLDWSKIGKKGYEALATALTDNKSTVTDMTLSVTNLNVESSKMMADALASNRSLTEIKFYFDSMVNAKGQFQGDVLIRSVLTYSQIVAITTQASMNAQNLKPYFLKSGLLAHLFKSTNVHFYKNYVAMIASLSVKLDTVTANDQQEKTKVLRELTVEVGDLLLFLKHHVNLHKQIQSIYLKLTAIYSSYLDQNGMEVISDNDHCDVDSFFHASSSYGNESSTDSEQEEETLDTTSTFLN